MDHIKSLLRRKVRTMTNTQLSNRILVLVLATMFVTFIPGADKVVAFAAAIIATANLSSDFARLIDWADDAKDLYIEIPWRYHALYCLGISIMAGAIFAVIGSALFSLPRELYLAISPRLLFFVVGFAASVLGYSLAWKTIPNDKKRGGRNE